MLSLGTRPAPRRVAALLAFALLAGSSVGEARRGQRPAGQPLSHPAPPREAKPAGQPAAPAPVPAQGDWGEKIEPVDDKLRPEPAPPRSSPPSA